MLSISPDDGRSIPTIVVDRWEWYRRVSSHNRMRYYATELLAICGSAAIPVATSLRLDPSVAAGLAAVVLIATGIRTTLGDHDNWIEHSQIRYDIEREAALFLVAAPPYDGENADQQLVVRVENLTSEGGRRWAARRQRTGPVNIPGVPPAASKQ